MEISVQNIVNLQQNGQLKRLSTFIYLKGLYKNSCVFKYNIKSLSRKSGMSRHLIRSNVNYFISQGWCYLHSGNLVFRKYEKDAVSGNYILRSKKEYIGKSIKEITTILLSKILKQSQIRFNWIQERKRDLNKSKTASDLTLKEYKKALRAERKYSITPGESVKFSMSIKKIAETFNVSKASASKLITQMQKMKLVQVVGNYSRFIGIGTGKYFESIKDMKRALYQLSDSGAIFQAQCNEYVFL